jgi:hypothetical protein
MVTRLAIYQNPRHFSFNDLRESSERNGANPAFELQKSGSAHRKIGF